MGTISCIPLEKLSVLAVWGTQIGAIGEDHSKMESLRFPCSLLASPSFIVPVFKPKAFAACRPRDHLAVAQRMRKPVERRLARAQRSVKEATNNSVISTSGRTQAAWPETTVSLDVRQMALQM